MARFRLLAALAAVAFVAMPAVAEELAGTPEERSGRLAPSRSVTAESSIPFSYLDDAQRPSAMRWTSA